MNRPRHLAAAADDVDDDAATARHHARQHGLHGVYVGKVFCVHGVMPGGNVNLFRRIAFSRPGRIHQNIHRPERTFDFSHDPLPGIAPAEIGTDTIGLMAPRFQL